MAVVGHHTYFSRPLSGCLHAVPVAEGHRECAHEASVAVHFIECLGGHAGGFPPVAEFHIV